MDPAAPHPIPPGTGIAILCEGMHGRLSTMFVLVVPSASSGGTKLCPPGGQKGPKDRPKEIPRGALMTQTSPTERKTTDPSGPKWPNSLQNRAPVPRLGSELVLGPGPGPVIGLGTKLPGLGTEMPGDGGFGTEMRCQEI